MATSDHDPEQTNERESTAWWKRPFQGELWRDANFLKLWTAQTLSGLGAQTAAIAVPLVAILTLEATALEVGMLRAAQALPALVFGLVAGVVVDRYRRRPTMVYTDIARVVLLGLIPLAAFFDALRIELLYAVGILAGTLKVFFDIANFSLLPSLIKRHQLVEGNSKLQGTYAASSMAGPSLGGVLVQVLTAPFAILSSSITGMISVLLVWSIRLDEPAPSLKTERSGVLREIREGLRYVLGHPILRPIVVTSAVVNVGFGMHVTVFILFVTRELGLSPALIGVILAASGPGFLLGAMVTGWITKVLGIGPTLIGMQAFAAFPMLLIPFVSGSSLVVAPLLAGAGFINATAAQVSGITAISLRQYVTPDRMLGRTNATMRFVSWSGAPLAALLAGWLAEVAGLRLTLFVAAIVMLIAVVPLLSVSIRLLSVLLDDSETV